MPLPKFEDFKTVWVEKTKASHGHGGKGWEFGTCLWSPTTDKLGKRIYKNMLIARPDELVLHFYEDAPFGRELDHYFCGVSVVDAAATIREAPPQPGDWAGRGEYYRVNFPLRGLSLPVVVSSRCRTNFDASDCRDDKEASRTAFQL
jgi:hypothetical protein